jgi:hypothetical protein
MEETNARGTDLVLATAQRLGLDPIVYVSSYVALLPASGRVLTAEPIAHNEILPHHSRMSHRNCRSTNATT